MLVVCGVKRYNDNGTAIYGKLGRMDVHKHIIPPKTDGGEQARGGASGPRDRACPGDVYAAVVWYTGGNVTLYLKRTFSLDWKWLGDYGV